MFRTIGERFTITPDPKFNSKRVKKRPRRPKKGSQSRGLNLRIDIPLLLAVVILLVFGLVTVYSASYDYSWRFFGDYDYIFGRQLMWFVVGVGILVTLVFLDYHLLTKIAVIALVVTIISLIAVLIIGDVRLGAARTLFEGSIQPSEMAKIITVVYLSVWLYSKRDNLSNIYFGLIPMAIILGLLVGLIFLQPDLSAMLTVMILGGVMFLLAGGDIKQIIIVLIVVVIVSFLLLQVFPTGALRIGEYITGLKDPSQGSYHVRRSLEAFVKGGLTGVGIGNSETKLTGLPVPHTDSVYAVVGEETGMIGALGLLVLFSVVLWRGLRIAQRAPDDMGALLAAGLAIWISIEAFINMAGLVNVLPFAGNALPYISSGGSNLLVMMAATGILLNISRMAVEREDQKGRLLSEVVNLRRRNRRRSVSRPGRPSGAEKKS